MKNKNECSTTCPYFPDFSIKSNEWEYDSINQIKRVGKEKKMLCGYDLHEIKWDYCPKKNGVV